MLGIFFVVTVAVIRVLGSDSSDSQTVPGGQISGGPFMYFAYGSNLMTKRIRLNNKSARCITRASLSDWRLDFNRTSESWNGAVATITPHANSTVWGLLWLVGSHELKNLDTQEGVHLGWYYAINVTVNALDLGPVVARTYVQPDPPAYVDPKNLPAERRPSKTYFEVILYGAVESNLPVNYLKYLQKFPHNGRSATTGRLGKLGYPFCDSTSCE